MAAGGDRQLWSWVQLQRQQRHLWRLLLYEPTAPVGNLGQTWSPLTGQQCRDVSLLTSLFLSLRGTRGEKARWSPEEGTCLIPFLKPFCSISLWPLSSTLLLSHNIKADSRSELVSLLSSHVGLTLGHHSCICEMGVLFLPWESLGE